MKNFAFAALLIGSAGAALAQTPAELCTESKMLNEDSEANRTALFACLTALANAQPPQPDIPAGAVIAFNGECPTDEGWEPFTEGHGKFIIGAGKGILVPSGPHNPGGDLDPRGLTELGLGDQGGEETHTLSPGEMPTHRHGIPMVTAPHDYLDDGLGTNAPYFDYTRRKDVRTKIGDSRPDQGVFAAGENQPHNNMPPYIALNLCVKKQ